MSKLIKKRSIKAGLPPGTLVHIGEKRSGAPVITLIDYDEANHQEREMKTVEECIPFREKPTVTWINVEGVHEPEVVERLGQCHGLHPLVLEDILNTDQRPKMEVYGDYVYIVLKMLYEGGAGRPVEAEQVSLIFGPNFVISFQEGKEGDVFNPVRERIRSGKGLIRKMESDYLVY